MILQGNFVLISVMDRTGTDGKVYHDANCEFDDGSVMRFGVSEQLLEVLTQKYQKYVGLFNIGEYQGKTYVRLKDAQLAKKS